MDIVTIAAISGFVAGAIDSATSGADPVASASIESYASIIDLHKKIGNIEDMLLDIHETLNIQPGQIDQALAVRSALDSEIQVWSSLQEHRSDRNGVLAQLRAGKTKDEIWMDYIRISAQNADDLSQKVFTLIESGPFSMEIALVGIAAEASILAEIEGDPDVIVGRVADKLERVEEKLDLHVGPLVHDASARLEEARMKIDAFIGGNDWMKGGEFLSGENSIAYTGTGLFLAACYDISVMEGPVSNGTVRYRLIGGGSRRYDVTGLWSLESKQDGGICGRPEIDISYKNTNDPLAKQLETYGILLTDSLPINRFGEWRANLEKLLISYNLKADYLDVIVGYEATIRYGINMLELNAKSIAMGGSSDEITSLGATLDALHAEYTGSDVWRIIEAERRIGSSRGEAFRQNFSDIAAGIDARVDAGLRRHATVIAAYERDQETLAIAGYFKALATLASAIDTLQDISVPKQEEGIGSSSETSVSRDEVQDITQRTIESTGAAEIAGVVSVAPGSDRGIAGAISPIVSQTDNAETRVKRFEAIITELNLLGPPTGKAENAGITRQEELIFEASALLGLWEMTEADRAYLDSSSDELESARDIAMKLGSGNLQGALLDIVAGTFKPTMIGDTSPASIFQARSSAKRLEPHVEATVRWRIPPAPSAQEVINDMILSSQSYPRMEAR